MPRDGHVTREKILTTATDLLYDYGFAGMSIDLVIDKAGITKGTFFYHFKNKDDLALAMVNRFSADESMSFYTMGERADALSRDPLQRYLILIGLFIEEFEKLNTPYPGCLYAAYCYQRGVLQDEALNIVERSILNWREQLTARLIEIKKKYPPRLPVQLDAVADMALVAFEGAFILSKTLNEPRLTANQLKQYRNYVELLFSPK